MHARAEIFTELRPALMKLARRMLRSDLEAEDMVQEAYLRWERTAAAEVRSPKAFLTTIVTRLCLNHLKLARVRLEHEEAPLLLDSLSCEARSPAEQAELADALCEAFMFALGDLSPTERAVFLLREGFAFDYDDIAAVVERSEENCRQILRRARERIAAKELTGVPAREQNQRVVSEFLSAAETGELEPLLRLLSNEAVLARGAGDLSKPAPPLIHDREILFQTLGMTLAEMRKASDRFDLFPIGQNYAYVARTGATAKGAILLRVTEQKVAIVRVVNCPALLHQLQILIAMNSGGDGKPGNSN
ncbi:MAG TPA: sigma-70 family RNA polymerase sigma factor [Candidatus Dormibacteraeota bacterium]|nr:sigma-70 family RNA polymerase sigma factor [Candidatus Dormibacteraeota bacterium]